MELDYHSGWQIARSVFYRLVSSPTLPYCNKVIHGHTMDDRPFVEENKALPLDFFQYILILTLVFNQVFSGLKQFHPSPWLSGFCIISP